MTERQRLDLFNRKPRNVKDCHPPPEARKRQGRVPYRFQREQGPADTLVSDFQPPEMHVRQHIYVVLSHPVCCTLLQQP